MPLIKNRLVLCYKLQGGFLIYTVCHLHQHVNILFKSCSLFWFHSFHLYHIYQKCKGHGKINIPFWNFELKAFRKQ